MTALKSNTVAMIPARIGSTRLPMKNLALLDGKPMIAYAIDAAQQSGVFDRVVVNSDDTVFAAVAERYGAEFYLRPKALGSSAAKSDEVVYDFMQKNPCEILCWVNSISPLQTGAEIRDVVTYFMDEDLDSLITVNRHQVHANYETAPLNYRTAELFAQTQDLVPVELFVYSVMMWRRAPFMNAYEKQGYAFFEGRVGFFPVSKLSSIIIKTAEDLKLAEYVLQSRQNANTRKLDYDPVLKEVNYA